jgi:hypothetical protein
MYFDHICGVCLFDFFPNVDLLSIKNSEILWGYGIRRIALVSIAISQFGFCAAYMIFISQNLWD